MTAAKKIVKSEIQDKVELVRHRAEQAFDRSRKTIDEMREHLPESVNQSLPWLSAGLAVGLVGFLAGRRSRRSKLDRPIRHLRDATGELPDAARAAGRIDYEPFFQLARLWLLTRIA